MRSPVRETQTLVIFGMSVSFVLGLVKLLSGLIGHSHALVADAVESLTDMVSGVVVWGGLHVSTRPASERHPYGYGKAESLAAVVVAGMIFAAGLGIAVESIHEILTPHYAPAGFTLVVLVVVIAVKEALARSFLKVAAETSSTAVHADGFHHRADAITSALAFVGISIALIGGPGWEAADDWAALLAAGLIIYNACRLVVVPVRELLDMHAEDVAKQAEDIATGVPGVSKVEKAFSRKSGSYYWVDMHVWVPASLNIRDAHAISHRVKDEIIKLLPSIQDVLIHLEPDDLPAGATSRSEDGVTPTK